MESISKRTEGTAEEWEFGDPKGPMMHWEGNRSEEDRQWMSSWFLARKAQLAKEKADSAGKAE
ncbi:MAG: hypothetical protein BGO21_06425 [Dyadobacter sp. 50-39]|uniref:hypothetical protein n=1 Tax=Dyadobacter sp. 50-39 TaxID=1895756 RepID=UPI00096345F5|nr:hypothetical protein [Dyadobacter sp. 50-39]OJV12377.1 MAG: hypothetical protein BGO21_06425 [Dyadobacter sp. 50-39]